VGDPRTSLLDLVDLDLSKPLTVTLLPLVLLAALLFKDDHLFAAAVADDGRLDGAFADLGVAACSEDEAGISIFAPWSSLIVGTRSFWPDSTGNCLPPVFMIA
jgi:hypothetical protein